MSYDCKNAEKTHSSRIAINRTSSLCHRWIRMTSHHSIQLLVPFIGLIPLSLASRAFFSATCSPVIECHAISAILAPPYPFSLLQSRSSFLVTLFSPLSHLFGAAACHITPAFEDINDFIPATLPSGTSVFPCQKVCPEKVKIN